MSPRSKEQNQRIRDGRREEILQAALKVFARKGLSAAKISEIAQTAGLSHGLIYHYFESKDEIFTELVRKAFEISLGIFAYAARGKEEPLERLREMTETILSGAFEGDSPYYFLMIIQAYTSDSVPSEVKELAREEELLYREYLKPIVVEGQKKGQIAAGDPDTMVTAYLSLIQGLAVLKIQGGEEIPLPGADIFLRLFQDSSLSLSGKTLSSHTRTGSFGPVPLKRAWLFYRSQEAGLEPVIIRSKTEEVMRDRRKIYRIVEENTASGEKTIIEVQAGDWLPISIRVLDQDERQIASVEYQNNTVTYNIPSRRLHRTIKVKGEYYDINMLSYLFQAFPFGHKKRIHFNLVTDGRRGSPVGSFPMYVMETGQEKIEVPEGSYDCYCLEMGIAGMTGIFASKYRYFFWYTVSSPHILVKFQDTPGGLSELVKIDVKED